jgi:Glyoxalase/Bleomycin resistance protein/Dioxygenase superfamily
MMRAVCPVKALARSTIIESITFNSEECAMSRFAGPLRQVGVVARDIDAAMHHWSVVLGVGPFIIFRDVLFEDYFYCGQNMPGPVVSLAVAQSGPLQIELIQQHNDAPSAYRDFLNAGHEGVQHLSSWFDNRADYDATRARLIGHGHQLIHEGRVQGVPLRFAYFTPGDPRDGPLLEISEAMMPEWAAYWLKLERIAAAWDGTNPVREASALFD